MVANQWGAGSLAFLLGLSLVVMAQAAVAHEDSQEDSEARLWTALEENLEALDSPEAMDTVEAPVDEGDGKDPLLLWLDDGAGSSGSGAVVLAAQDAPDQTLDQMETAEAATRKTTESVERAAETAETRLVGQEQANANEDEQTEEGHAGSGSDDGSGQAPDENGPSLTESACAFLEGLCAAPVVPGVDPGLPRPATSIPGLPLPSGLEGTPEPAFDNGLEEQGVAPQQSSVATEDANAGSMMVIAAAAAATAIVAAAVAGAGSTGSAFWAWIGRALAAMKGLFLSLYARLSKDKVLDHRTRKEVYLFLQANPGACITQIQRALETSLGTTRHHLQSLQTHGLVVDVKSGRKRCFFTREDGLSAKARTATAALSSKAARRVFSAIEREPGISQQALAEALGVSRTAVIFHVRRLQQAGMIRQDQVGRQVVYHPEGGTGHEPVPGATSAGSFTGSGVRATPDFSS